MMGIFCCCFHVDDLGDSSLNTSNNNETCKCPNCRIHTFLKKYAALFNKNQTPGAEASDSNQEAVSSITNSSPLDDTLSDTTTSQPRTLRMERDNKSSTLTEAESIQCYLGLSLRSPLKKEESEDANSSSEDEDFCPTCLEEYTAENPKIITQCRHHYHLSCIYEWMERSPTCPICNEVTVFIETN